MTVLVLTRPILDATADLVIAELSERGVPVHRLNPGDFPEDLAMTARIGPGEENWRGIWRGRHRDLRLEAVTAVYYRRPGPFRLHPNLSSEDARWAAEEARGGLGGVLTSLDCRWVNHPHRNAIAGFAPVALATASRCGLRVPRTVITNDPAEARDFIRSQPDEVAAYKSIAAAGPRDHEGHAYAVWTSRIHADEITEDVARTAHLFQEWVTKAYEVRVTGVGTRLFAAEIHAGSGAARIDFRRDYDSLAYKLCDVPDAIAGGVRRLMDAFGLRYVALDFLVNHSGIWHLVDVNPGGQFGFVPELCDPITRALADELEGRIP